jgi:hypothetical protein
MSHPRRGLAAVPFIAIAIVALAGTIDPRKDDAKHREYGDKFKCVARIVCRNAKTGVEQSASCVIVSPRCVVTAAHVVDGCEEHFVLCDNGERHDIESVATHPDFANEKSVDLAVCKAKRPFSLDFYPPLHALKDEPGQVASISGYGLTGTFDTGGVIYDGQKRAGSNVVDRAERGLLICSVDSHRKTELEFLIASGDSGGGLFLGNELAGINSFLMVAGRSPMARRGEESAHTRISEYREWIEGAINGEK